RGGVRRLVDGRRRRDARGRDHRERRLRRACRGRFDHAGGLPGRGRARRRAHCARRLSGPGRLRPTVPRHRPRRPHRPGGRADRGAAGDGPRRGRPGDRREAARRPVQRARPSRGPGRRSGAGPAGARRAADRGRTRRRRGGARPGGRARGGARGLRRPRLPPRRHAHAPLAAGGGAHRSGGGGRPGAVDRDLPRGARGRRQLGRAPGPLALPARGHPRRGGARPHGARAAGGGGRPARGGAVSRRSDRGGHGEDVERSDDARGGRLDPPLATHRAGEAALLAEYPGTEEVLAAAAAVRELAPAHLIDLVPAERTLLLAGAEAQDLPVLAALLEDLPPAASQHSDSGEVTVDVVYDGEDLAEVADLLGMSVQALIAAHSGTIWTAAFGGFAPGFAYLLPDAAHPGSAARPGRGARSHHGPRSGDTPRPGGPPWEVPRRAEPRTAVPVGAVGLASRYCGIYPRSCPGGWQLIGRSDAPLFDPDREPPALLTPGTRVRFAPQRSAARLSTTTSTLAQAAREAAAVPGRLGRRRPAAGPRAGH